MYCARHVVNDLDTPWRETTGSRSRLSRQSHKGEHHPLSVTGELLGDSRAPTAQETIENANVLSQGIFDERVLVEGCPSSIIYMGGLLLHAKLPSGGGDDVAAQSVQDKRQKFGGPHVALSLKVHANATASAGFFSPNKTARTLKEGDAMVLTAQLHQHWTLERVGKVLYRKRNKGKQYANRAVWRRELE